MNDTWLPILKEFQSLDLDDVLDFNRFNGYSIVHHSTAIEGATLTEVETRVLLEDGRTPAGKPLAHSLMVKDHYQALQLTLKRASEKSPVTVGLIHEINAAVMASTGGTYNTALGSVDASKGEFRKGNVSAGGSYFIGFDKVPSYTEKFATNLQEQIERKDHNYDSILRLSFAAHFDLVNIHPFYDGNGRTSRLLMNYVQYRFGLPLAIVFAEDRVNYLNALIEANKQQDLEIFHSFMFGQYAKHLQREITRYQQMENNNTNDKKKGGHGLSIFL